jgi:hypothetical protein
MDFLRIFISPDVLHAYEVEINENRNKITERVRIIGSFEMHPVFLVSVAIDGHGTERNQPFIKWLAVYIAVKKPG